MVGLVVAILFLITLGGRFMYANTKLPQQLSTSSSTKAVATIPGLPAGQTTAIAHSDIITTVFWVGEKSGPENGYIANTQSAWDENWQKNYGGVDSPTKRNGYQPAGFTPKQNPFYFALPYNDFDSNSDRRDTAKLCMPTDLQQKSDASWCKNKWIKITFNKKDVYAQWQDVGPYNEDDTDYVFGTKAPQNTKGEKAGLDVSPAVKYYLGLNDVSTTSWVFVAEADVPSGPWSAIITNN